jgi:FkbM family methyltransferase
MVQLCRHPDLEDYFVELDPSDPDAAARVVELYEAGKVVVLRDCRLDCDHEFLSRLAFPPEPGLKKFKSQRFLRDPQAKRAGVENALLERVFAGSRRELERFRGQVAAVNAQLLALCRRFFPDYEILGDSITWRMSPTLNENLHVDVYKEDLPDHHLRLFVNLDAAHRIWHTSFTLEQLLRDRLGMLAPEFLRDAPPGRLGHDLNFAVFGGMDAAGQDGQPRHFAAFAPGEIWLVDSRQVSHQVVYGQRAVSTDFAIAARSMRDPARHYHALIDRHRRERLAAAKPPPSAAPPRARWEATPRRATPPQHVLHDSETFRAPCLEVEIGGRRLRFVESNRLAKKRVATLLAKEPTTIPWLESIPADGVLVDVGANVGMYSVYAAVMTGCRVCAFEPEALNYAELNKNLFVNGLHDRATAWCIALADRRAVGCLHLSTFGASHSHHDFGERVERADPYAALRRDGPRELRQGAVAFTLDELVEDGVLPVPTHLKIDVDGLEPRVLAGAERTLRDPRVESVLVEVDHRLPDGEAILARMTGAGWRWSLDQLRANRKAILSPEQVAAVRQKGSGGFNYVFFRDERYAELFARFLASYTPGYAPLVGSQ